MVSASSLQSQHVSAISQNNITLAVYFCKISFENLELFFCTGGNMDCGDTTDNNKCILVIGFFF
jgi:hypothetical protein